MSIRSLFLSFLDIEEPSWPFDMGILHDISKYVVNIITCGMVSLRLQMLDARDDERNESIGGSGSGEPHNDDAQDVDDRNDTESDRFRCGDI